MKLETEEISSYWETFYKGNAALSDPSSFAQFILTKIPTPLLTTYQTTHLVDMGCGNGRDSLFFGLSGLNVTSIDQVAQPNFLAGNKFIQMDITQLETKADIYYGRFFIHAMKEDTFDTLLEKLSTLMDANTLFVIETRSTKGITDETKSETNFKSSIGQEHFRILYSKEYLQNKLEQYFNIEYIEEKNGLATYKGDDPYVIRVIAKLK